MTFDIDFEEQILAKCLNDTAYLASAAKLLDAYHFTTKQHGWIWTSLKTAWFQHKEQLTPKLLSARVSRDFKTDEERKPVLELAVKLYGTKPVASHATLDELRQFVRFVHMQSAMERGLQHMEKGDMDKCYDLIKQTVTSDMHPVTYKVTKWMEQFEERMAEQKHKRDNPDQYIRIPTGIGRLDKIIGGIQASEVGLIIANTGRGKSIFLNHLGYQAILRDYNVLHLSNEMPDKQVAMRYDSRFTGVLHERFKYYSHTKDDLDTIQARLAKNKARLINKLRIVAMPLRRCDIDSVKSALDDAKAEMGKVHLVLVDSGDHMRGVGRFEGIRLEQASVYWDLKSLAGEEELGVWSSTQASKEWEERVISRTGAASEAYDKEQIADIVLTLYDPKSRTRASRVVVGAGEATSGVVNQPKITKSSGDLELFLAKYRDGEGKISIPLDIELGRMLIQEASQQP